MNHTIITIGRQFGSGGRQIAKEIAKQLGFSYYDKELLVKISEASGLATSFLESLDERQSSPFFYSLMNSPASFVWDDHLLSTDLLAHKAQRETIQKIANEEDCVIVGRCADYILRDQPGLIRIFICATYEDRVQHVMQRDNITEKEAKKRIKEMEKSRAAYYNFNTDQKWGDASNYDLCINTSQFGFEKTAELIIEFIKQIRG